MHVGRKLQNDSTSHVSSLVASKAMTSKLCHCSVAPVESKVSQSIPALKPLPKSRNVSQYTRMFPDRVITAYLLRTQLCM